MRMWCVPPQLMCRQHLLGEHVELHIIVSHIVRGQKLDGFYAKGLIDTKLIKKRHADIVEELSNRGWEHKSPLPEFTDPQKGFITDRSLDALLERCSACRLLNRLSEEPLP